MSGRGGSGAHGPGAPGRPAPGAPGVPAPASPSAQHARRDDLGRPILLLLGLFLLAFFSPLIGPVRIPPVQVLQIVLHQGTGGLVGGGACASYIAPSQCVSWVEIVWGSRVPAVVLAILAGAALGLSGAGLQGVFRNALADPYLLGLSAGAALGAAAALAVLSSPRPGVPAGATPLLLPLAAFLGGMLPGSVVLLASLRGVRAPQTLLLTGVALNAFLSSILLWVLLFEPQVNLPVYYWLLGELSYAVWPNDGILLAVLMVTGLLLALHGPALNLLQLGDDVARSLGTDPRRATQRVVLLATVASATAVAFAGVIGFVGLVGPHIVRRLVGMDYRKVLPLSMATGGAFLLLAWDIAQVIVPGIVVPVGIPTSFVGSLFFLYVLLRRARSPGGP